MAADGRWPRADRTRPRRGARPRAAAPGRAPRRLPRRGRRALLLPARRGRRRAAPPTRACARRATVPALRPLRRRRLRRARLRLRSTDAEQRLAARTRAGVLRAVRRRARRRADTAYRVPAKAVLPGIGVAGTFWRPGAGRGDAGAARSAAGWSSICARVTTPRCGDRSGALARRVVTVRVLSPLPSGRPRCRQLCEQVREGPTRCRARPAAGRRRAGRDGHRRGRGVADRRRARRAGWHEPSRAAHSLRRERLYTCTFGSVQAPRA